MKYIEKLLNGAEVKWMTVEEISKNISSGGTPRSNVAAYYGGNIPWLRTQEVNFREIWDTGIKITEEGLNSSSAKYIPANCIIVAMYGATVGRVGINKIPLTTNQACANIEVNDNIAYYRYIYHYLSSQYEYIKSLGAGSQTNINAGIVKKIKVPIPPLYVQEEIVRILDKFTTLEAELEAELDCRKRQYEYYRNQLLSFSNDVEWKSLGNVFDFRNGKGHEKEIVPAGEFIVINSKFISSNGLVVKFSNRQLSPVYKGDILMVMSDLPNGKALAKCFLVDKDSTYTLNQRVCGLTIKNSKEMNPKFAFYILSRNKHLLKYNNGVDQTNLRKDDILKISIPIPSLAEQQRIVSILDKFEALTTSISEGLPKEIELRRKQYEYYRNQLLSFA
jgi:restriction modification system DNA specificity domain protein